MIRLRYPLKADRRLGQAEAMLLLLFHIGENLYAIDTAPVIEIVPMVLLRKIQPAPEHVAGVFNYRGDLVPAIDLCCLIRGTPCAACYSSRMIIVRYCSNAAQIALEPNSDANFIAEKPVRGDRQRQFGLLAERVTETLKVSSEQLQTAERISTSPYLGELFVHERGVIQKVNWEQLITDADQAALLAGGRDRANGAGRN